MARLRQQLSLREGLFICLGAVVMLAIPVTFATPGGAAARTGLLGGVDAWAWVAALLSLEFVVQPLSTLIHELGHAVAVLLLSRRKVLVGVGRGPWLDLTLGRLRVRFSVRPVRGIRIRGACFYDKRGMAWRRIAIVYAAGPLATLLELAVVASIAPLLWAHGVFYRYLIVLTAIYLASSVVTNLRPRFIKDNKGGATKIPNDGLGLRAALAKHRAGVPPPRGAAPASRPTTRLRLGPQDSQTRLVSNGGGAHLRPSVPPPAPKA